MNTNTEFSICGRQLRLLRFPEQGAHSSLQAWDAADELLLNHLSEQNLIASKGIAIINDDFGALYCALADASPLVFSDSFMAHTAIKQNAKRNELSAPWLYSPLALEQAQFTREALLDPSAGSHEQATSPLSLVLIKIPRTLALLEQQLIALRQHITPNTQIIAAAKVKSVTSNVLKMFERYIGPTKTSLAVKKARLIFAQALNSDDNANPLNDIKSPFPSVVTDPAIEFSLYNHANVFCRDQLDIGARLMLSHLPSHFSGSCIDLGCGNGVLGIAMMKQNPDASMVFVDESFMAIASAKLSVEHAFKGSDKSKNIGFEVSHCLHSLLQRSAEPVDMVLCNPPFHQQNVITDEIAWQMFLDAKRMLKPGGELRIVANRHLDYPNKLKRLFGACKLVANNRKFVVLSAIKQR
ncbi:methyltransferase [Glaciecola siphonariae]|uniref:Ribosomal RNA large subunit methyltransferase G n=1 Tax=Glaciecola siphonariae TaxID=521012 RepID=A0ABV9LVC2_9ALTE